MSQMKEKGSPDSVTIRRAAVEDVDDVARIYEAARMYMRATGNMTQWVNGYPTRENILSDIGRGAAYVGVDDKNDIVMAFAFIVGNDPTYDVIEDGEWLNDEPYGTIHRLGSNGRYSGMLALCVDFCSRHISNLRIDTHADNTTMLNGAERLGFTRCGIIYCQDGTPRIAFQRCIQPHS